MSTTTRPTINTTYLPARTPTAPAEPPVISPAPAAPPRTTTTGQGTVNEVSITHVRLQLPPHVYDAYSDQAARQNKDPETLMAERLIRCLLHNEDGLWFNESERKRLESFLGRKCGDAIGVIQRLEPMRGIVVAGVQVEIPAITLTRLSTRVRRGQTLEQLIQTETIRALRAYVGQF